MVQLRDTEADVSTVVEARLRPAMAHVERLAQQLAWYDHNAFRTVCSLDDMFYQARMAERLLVAIGRFFRQFSDDPMKLHNRFNHVYHRTRIELKG